MTCEQHTQLSERVAKSETEIHHNKKFIQDVHDDHELTKKEMTKIKMTVAKYSCIGGLVSAILVKVFATSIRLSFVQDSLYICKAIWRMVCPDSYAGN